MEQIGLALDPSTYSMQLACDVDYTDKVTCYSIYDTCNQMKTSDSSEGVTVAEYKARRYQELLVVRGLGLGIVDEYVAGAVSPLELDHVSVAFNKAMYPIAGLSKFRALTLSSSALCTSKHPWLGRPIDQFDWRLVPINVITIACECASHSCRKRQITVVTILLCRLDLPRPVAGLIAELAVPLP